MSRRLARKAPKTKMVAWKPEFLELFKLGDGFTPPARIQVRRTKLGATVVAIFTADGRPVRATTRIEIDCATDQMFLVDQKLSISARVYGGGKAKGQ